MIYLSRSWNVQWFRIFLNEWSYNPFILSMLNFLIFDLGYFSIPNPIFLILLLVNEILSCLFIYLVCVFCFVVKDVKSIAPSSSVIISLSDSIGSESGISIGISAHIENPFDCFSFVPFSSRFSKLGSASEAVFLLLLGLFRVTLLSQRSELNISLFQ